MTDVFVGLGSNLGDSAQTLLAAWHLLGEQEGIELKEISRPYISSPVGMESNYWFTNAVGHLLTTLSAHRLLDVLLGTEQSLGRSRDEYYKGYQDRVVDLDLLYYSSLVHDDPRLTIPHPHLGKRLFVLAPLVSIAPGFVDPVSKNSILEMHGDLVDRIGRGGAETQEIKETAWPD